MSWSSFSPVVVVGSVSPKPERPPSRLGILAGSGGLPRELAEACRAVGQPVFVIDLEGRASDWAARFDHARLSLGQVGAALEVLKAAGCDAVAMAGGVERPALLKLRMDWQGMRLLPRLLRYARAGDDGLLRGVASLFEEHGFRVLAPEAFLGASSLAPLGPIAGSALSPEAAAEAALGFEILAALSPYDIGQAVVIRGGQCLAIEGAEGTAAMLDRVANLRSRDGGTGGLLVKSPKIGQDTRLDRPAIGPDTVRSVHAAGMSAIVLGAGGVFLVDRAEIIRRADQLGIAIHGISGGAS